MLSKRANDNQPGSARKNPETFGSGNFSLSPVKRTESVRLVDQSRGDVQNVQGTGAKLGRVPAREPYGGLPDLAAQLFSLKDAGGNIREEIISNRARCRGRPVFEKNTKLTGVQKFGLTEGRQEENGPTALDERDGRG